MSKNNKNSVKKGQGPRKINHVFVGCRDVIIGGNAATSQQPATAFTNSAGSFGQVWPLCPLGLTTAVYTSSAYTIGTPGNVSPPILRGLYNRAVTFQWYRITRAKLVFVGNVGSTSTGTLTLAGYTDPIDVAAPTTIPTVSNSTATKVFDLASSSTKELSISIPIDSAWKKVSSILLEPAGASPFSGNSTTMLVPVNSVADLCFGAISVAVAGGPASAAVGNMYIDYDVEFKGVIDLSLNG